MDPALSKIIEDNPIGRSLDVVRTKYTLEDLESLDKNGVHSTHLP